MRMYIQLMFLFLSLTCSAEEGTFFLYQGKVLKVSDTQLKTIKKLSFDKRNSVVEFACIEGFLVIRVSENIFKLVDIPKRRRSNSRIDLLLEEEAKVDEDLKQI